MAANDIQRHFKSLRVQTARRRRDPFAEDSDDDSDERRDRRSKSSASAAKKPAPPVEKPVTSAPSTAPAAPFKSSALSAADKLLESDDDWLAPAARSDRRPSPAPAQLARSVVSPGAGRRGSLDAGLQSQGLHAHRDSRSARAQAAGPLAYLDDSDDEEALQPPPRADRHPSPAPRKSSDSGGTERRSSTPRGSRDAPSEQHPVVPSRHTVASPFAGTKYLEDSDSDEEAVTSRSNSTDETAASSVSSPDKKEHLEVKRVDKPKVQNGGGVSWRAFSASRTEQRNTEIEALQTSLRKRGKSISFGTHALTDDGQRVPIPSQQLLAAGGGSKRGRTKNRGKSPPRRAEDTAAAEDEVADGGPVGVYDPKQFKTNPFTGESQFAGKTATQNVMETPNDRPVAEASQVSVSSFLQSDDGPISPVSPERRSSLSDSIGSLSSKVAVSPPQTITEGKPLENSLDQLISPVASPTSAAGAEDWPSRSSSTRAMRTSRPVRVPTNPEGRRANRRSTSNKTSVSPAHAFLSSWGNRGAVAAEPAAEPKPDDEGQAIGDSEYIIGRTINQGGFGVVKEVHTITDSGAALVRAVKIVRKSIPGADEALNEKAQVELEHEVSVWRHLKHRHILNLDVVYDTEFATFCIMELNVGGTLFDMVRKARASVAENDGRKGLDPKLAKNYAHQLASALRYLHEDIRVCHRDVKLENCLIDMSVPNADTEGGHLRLCDFGLADFLNSDRSIDDTSSETLVGGMLSPPSRAPAVQHPTTSSVIGTLEYASPKGLSVNRKLFETAGDVWAFGVIVYVLCTGDLPFKHSMPSKTVEMILQADWDDNALLNAAAGGSEVRELVVGCFEKDIDLRLTIGGALRSGWFEGCVELEDEGGGRDIWR